MNADRNPHTVIRKCTKAERLAREAEARKKTHAQVKERAKHVAELQASGKTWQEQVRERMKEKAKKEAEGRAQER